MIARYKPTLTAQSSAHSKLCVPNPAIAGTHARTQRYDANDLIHKSS